jgi:heme-degrading monooxygenase HmoA
MEVGTMAVLATTVIPGLDAESYDQMVGHLGAALSGSPGFRMHSARPERDGWTVSEVWDSESDFRAFFEANVKANLPPGVEPQLRPLHNVVVSS